MVYGIEKFKEYFANYKNNYVLIGGAACDVIMEDVEVEFRATKDLDIVVLVDITTKDFGKQLWQFIKDGKYQNQQKSTGKNQYYRFINPQKNDFPFMLELFSKKSFELKIDNNFTPIHISEELYSLSAILLNENYYNLLFDGKKDLDELTVLSEEYLIIFKIKAWLDLKERKLQGQNVDSKDIKKHKNDVFRLLILLDPDLKIPIENIIKEDIRKFIDTIDNFNLRDINILTIKFDQALEMLRKIYL